MPTATQLGSELFTKRQELAKLFADHKQADGSFDFTGEQLGEVNKRNDEINALAKGWEDAVKLERVEAETKAAIAPAQRSAEAGQPGQAPAAKASGPRELKDILTDRKLSNWEQVVKGELPPVMLRIEIPEAEWKTLVTLGGIAPNPDRQPQITGYPLALQTIDDLLLSGETDSNTVTYYEETAETDNTAARTEGSAVTDNAMTFILRTDTLRSVTTWQPVTREALADIPQFESFLRERLPMLLAAKRTGYLIDGTGIAPVPLGLMRRTGVQTQAKGADPVFDAVMKGMTLGAVTGGAQPTAVIFHNNDWQDLVLTRTTEGLYILGNPSSDVPTRLWGLQIRVTPQAVENTAVVFSKPFVQVFRKRGAGVVIETSTEHSTYFTERSVAVLAEERLTLACYRGASIVKVTGI
ncbi:MAG: phage major capsid protein [Chloroflexota bacterium]